MRIVLRRRSDHEYLQPSGEWSPDRDTAREFLTSMLAYYWALEQKLLGVDVLLTFNNPVWDHVTDLGT